MSKAKVKKALESLPKEGIIESVLELYDARPEARDYLEYWLDPNPDKAFEDFTDKVTKMFFYSTGKNRSQPKQNDLRRVVKDFSSLVFDSDKIAMLYLHIAESHAKWVSQKPRGRSVAEKALRRNLQLAMEYIEGAALEEQFALRIQNLTENIDNILSASEQPSRRGRGWRRYFY